MSSSPLPKLFCLVGPTATGKSFLARQIAQDLGAHIVNSDSRQFYQEMNVATAKPSPEEQQSVPHHLIDCTSIEQPWNVGQFVAAADAVINKLWQNKTPIILVGGTGLYLRSLLFGIAKIPAISPQTRQKFKSEYKKFGIKKLYDKLKVVDPQAAARFPATDTQRILRALEVFDQTGKTLHEFWQDDPRQKRYNTLKICLTDERKKLYQRIDQRVESMFDCGLATEAKDLWQRFAANPVLEKTIGYAEWKQHGFECADLVKAEIQKNTRRFAKRQLTWFKKEEGILWFDRDQTAKIKTSVQSFFD